jgi:hypothetical protein
MRGVIPGHGWVADADASDLALLADAVRAAVDAASAGRVLGPAVCEVSWRRVVRRALRADLSRRLRVATVDGVA